MCVLGPCAFVLGVWCGCVAFDYIVRPSPVNVVDITGCAGPCFVLARACLRFARLCPPCPRCVYLLCVRLLCMLALRALALLFVPLLCVSALCAFVLVVWCACAALNYIVWSSPTLHPRRPRRLAMPFTVPPFSVTYACSCHA